MDATTPGPLAPDLLEREDVRRALAEHDFAAAFTLIKKYGGLSRNRIASACHLTPGKVSTIISGQRQVTSFEVICRISDGLRIPGHLLGLAPRAWETRPIQEDPLPETVQVSQHQQSEHAKPQFRGPNTWVPSRKRHLRPTHYETTSLRVA